MTLNLKRKAAIEDLFDRYCQRGDVDTITVSTIPITSTGIQLLISCPSMHGLERTHEALNNSVTLGLNPTSKDKNNSSNNNNSSGDNNNNNDGNNNNKNGDDSKKDDNNNANNNNNQGGDDKNNNNNNEKKTQRLVHNQGNGMDNANAILNTNSSSYNNLADPNGETEDEKRERHTVRCGVETILQLAKFKQASTDAGLGSSVMITSQYSNFLLNQFVSGPLLVTLGAKRCEGRSLGLLVALANEIKAEPVFKQFIEAAIETRLNG
jgi:hypothetical protein